MAAAAATECFLVILSLSPYGCRSVQSDELGPRRVRFRAMSEYAPWQGGAQLTKRVTQPYPSLANSRTNASGCALQGQLTRLIGVIHLCVKWRNSSPIVVTQLAGTPTSAAVPAPRHERRIGQGYCAFCGAVCIFYEIERHIRRLVCEIYLEQRDGPATG